MFNSNSALVIIASLTLAFFSATRGTKAFGGGVSDNGLLQVKGNRIQNKNGEDWGAS
eukprot:Pgem_evm1s9127